MKKYSNKFLALLIALCLVIAPLSGALAANGDHITVNLTGVPTNVNLETGQLHTQVLTGIFNDPSGHGLTYSINETNLGPHTHIATPNGIPTLVFTVANADTYYCTVRATCSAGDFAEFTITFNVTLASDGTPSQYSYEETAQSSVRVYVTISNDGMPIKGANGTIMANLPVDVPYFDLYNYGLSDYYRFPTNGGSGAYISSDPDDVIQRPTALHLYLYLMERYYMGLSAENCGIGTSGVLNYDSSESISYIDGTPAYSSGTGNAITISGSATSLYLTRFWGHDCNLMYFRNHVFPLMSPGWGATCDYALLSDGDVIEIAMFSDWGFYSNGAFLRFNGYDKLASRNISRGQLLSVNVQRFDTFSGACFTDTEEELWVAIYKSDGTYLSDFTWVNNDGNTYSYSVPNNLPTGLYYVIAMDLEACTDDACLAPAVMTVNVY